MGEGRGVSVFFTKSEKKSFYAPLRRGEVKRDNLQIGSSTFGGGILCSPSLALEIPWSNYAEKFNRDSMSRYKKIYRTKIICCGSVC